MNNKWKQFNDYDTSCILEKNMDTGLLSIKVKNRESGKPITFAEISIYLLTIKGVYSESAEANLIVRDVTDGEGKIPLIELPVIDKRILPLSQYYMTVSHFRYFPIAVMNIEIFPDVTTEYNILLTPLTSKHPDYKYIITPARP